MIQRSRHSASLIATAACLSALLCGCVSTAPVAPSITAAMQTQSGASMETLKSGREVFVYRCTSCHTIDPVSRHPMTYWRHAVEDMASRAKLTASEHAAIVAYLSAAHEAPTH